MMRIKNKIPVLGALLLLLCNCMAGGTGMKNAADFYPELPDNETCFQKIAQLRAYTGNPANRKVETQIVNGQTQTWEVVDPPYTLDAYLGILTGRGALAKRQLAVTAGQCKIIFKHLNTIPEFIVDAEGTSEEDPGRYSVVTIYFKPADRQKFESWLEQIIPADTLPRQVDVKP